MATRKTTAPVPASSVETQGTTTLDADVTVPSVTAPGDGPADTTDPTERATSVAPDPGEEALAVGTVNAVKPLPKANATEPETGEERFEEYEATKPDGTVVTIRRSITTGASEIIGEK